MSGDKRSVATDALEVLGLPDLGGREVGRDAIHLAVEPAVAGHFLMPGQKIIRAIDGRWIAAAGKNPLAIVDPFLSEGVSEGERFLAIIPPRQITSLRHVWSHPDFPEEAAAGAPSAEPESSPAMFSEKAEEEKKEEVDEDERDRAEADLLSRRISSAVGDEYEEGTREHSEAWIRKMVDMCDCPDYDVLVGVASGDNTVGADLDYGGRHAQWDDDYLHFSGLDAHGVIPSQFWHHLKIVAGIDPPKKSTYFSCSC
jgi:hypothetical protein